MHREKMKESYENPTVPATSGKTRMAWLKAWAEKKVIPYFVDLRKSGSQISINFLNLFKK